MSDNFDVDVLFEQINTSDGEDDLSGALRDMIIAVPPLLPHLETRPRLYVPALVKGCVQEATTASVETLWWEMRLFLAEQMVANLGSRAAPFYESVERLRPLLHAHFGPPGPVSLQPITAKTVFGICLLSDTLTDPQDAFVARNAVSLAEAHFNPDAWFRAVYAGKTPVGFVMMEDNPDEQYYYIWRFMIAAPYQGRGHGKAAIQRIIERTRTRPGAVRVVVSCVPDPRGPLDFYLRCGFEDSGQVEGGEMVLWYPLER